MAIWEGYDPLYPYTTFNIRQYARDLSQDGFRNPEDPEPVPWWHIGETGGVTITPDFCKGAQCEDMPSECTGCANCEAPEPADPPDPDDDGDGCVTDVPNAVNFQPFWVRSQFKCDPAGRDPNDLYRSLDRHLEARAWNAIARRYHLYLQSKAKDISSDTPTCIADAIGSLIRARGVAGVHPGVLVVPGYLIPALQISGVLGSTAAGLPVAAGSIPVIADPGFPTSGPTDSTGGTWVYITHRPPEVAFRNIRHPHNGPFDFQNDEHRARFFNDDCKGDCFEPLIKRQAIFVADTCGTFAVPIKPCGG